MSETESDCEDQTLSLATANNHLAVSLHRLLAEGNGNVFFSPFSISSAMAMLLCASEGETEAEMVTTLGYDQADLDKGKIASAFYHQTAHFMKTPDAYTLSCANSMLNQEDFPVKEEYKQILAQSFNALLLEIDFIDESEKAISVINEWVKEKTNGMITELVDSLDPSTVIILLNAVYFKGTWVNQFDIDQTFQQPFYNNGAEDNIKEIDMMHLKETFPFYENDSMQVLQLPYAGEEVAMLLLLPKEKDGLESLEADLAPSFLQDLKENLRKQKVEVTLPKFRLEYTKSLVPCFQQLGIKKAFSRGADFGVASDSPDLAVSEILHKAVLEVNEEGSEAAAVTMVGITMCALIFDPEFVADHPFAFIIYDTTSDLILFMGRVDELS